jgi:hypothetical protein
MRALAIGRDSANGSSPLPDALRSMLEARIDHFGGDNGGMQSMNTVLRQGMSQIEKNKREFVTKVRGVPFSKSIVASY